MLMPPDADDVLSQGYQLHIKASLCERQVSCIKPITKNYGLSLAHEPAKQLLVIYRPIRK